MDHSTCMEENETYGLNYDPMWKEKDNTASTKSLEGKAIQPMIFVKRYIAQLPRRTDGKCYSDIKD